MFTENVEVYKTVGQLPLKSYTYIDFPKSSLLAYALNNV